MSANREHCRYCFDVLLSHLTKTPKKAVVNFDTSVEFPLFVTWDKQSAHSGELRLRGCIGNFSPMNLEDGLREYALTSALHDTRFSPISLKEVPSLTCTVSLLTDFEAAVSHLDWEIGKHGVWIEFRGKRGERRTATFLPQIASEQGWTKLETIDQLLRKGGYHDEPTQEMYGAIKLTRYQSKKAELTYSEYVAME